MFLTLTELGKLYNISAIKTGKILYALGVRDPNHPIEKGFPFEQYITHNIAQAKLGHDGEIKYFTYDIATIKEEFEQLLKAPKKENIQERILKKISFLQDLSQEIDNTKLKEDFLQTLQDIRYLSQQDNLHTTLPLDEKAAALYERLKTYRKHKAQSQNISAFLIFSNAVLHLLSFHQPHSLEELEEIKGIGEKKIKDYGKEILTIIHSIKDWQG